MRCRIEVQQNKHICGCEDYAQHMGCCSMTWCKVIQQDSSKTGSECAPVAQPDVMLLHQACVNIAGKQVLTSELRPGTGILEGFDSQQTTNKFESVTHLCTANNFTIPHEFSSGPCRLQRDQYYHCSKTQHVLLIVQCNNVCRLLSSLVSTNGQAVLPNAYLCC